MSTFGFSSLKKCRGVYSLWVKSPEFESGWGFYKLYHNIGHAKAAITVKKEYKGNHNIEVRIFDERENRLVWEGTVGEFKP